MVNVDCVSGCAKSRTSTAHYMVFHFQQGHTIIYSYSVHCNSFQITAMCEAFLLIFRWEHNFHHGASTACALWNAFEHILFASCYYERSVQFMFRHYNINTCFVCVLWKEVRFSCISLYFSQQYIASEYVKLIEV